MKPKHILLRTILSCLFAVLFILSASLLIYAKADTKADTKAYFLDEGNLLNDSQKQLNEAQLKEYNAASPYQAVIITGNQNQPLTEAQMQERADRLVTKEGYGEYNDLKIGAVCLFINQSPAGKVDMNIILTGELKEYYSDYNSKYMKKALQEMYATTSNWKDVTVLFLRLVIAYQLPIIDQTSEQLLSFDEVQKASQEVNQWADLYNQHIVFMLTDELSEDDFFDYADNYFHANGYGEGIDGSGVFCLFDTLNRCTIRFYGSADTAASNRSELLTQVQQLLSDRKILDAVYAVERFLNPNASVPVYAKETEPKKAPLDYTFTLDAYDFLGPELAFDLDYRATAFFDRFGHTVLTHVFPSTIEFPMSIDEYMKDELKSNVGEDGSGMIMLFETDSKECHFYVTGALRDILEDKTKGVTPVLEHLQSELRRQDYSFEAIYWNQLKLIQFLEFVNVYHGTENYLVSDEPTSLLEYADTTASMQKIAKAGIRPIILMVNHPYAGTIGEHIQDFKALVQASGMAEKVILLFHFINDSEVSVQYFGSNSKITDIINNSLQDEIFTKYIENLSNQETTFLHFMEAVEQQILPVLQAGDRKEDSPSDSSLSKEEATKDNVTAKDKKSGFALLANKIFIGGAVLFLLVLCVVVVVVRAKKKSKKVALSQPTSPAYSQGFQQNPQGFTQAPQGFQQSPQGFAQAPQGFQQSPQGFTQAPQGFQQSPQGFAQAPQDFSQVPQEQDSYRNKNTPLN